MNFKKVFLTLIIALISLHRLPADEVRFFDNSSISSHLLTCLCQDSDGYIWIGTEYGLNRFDGMTFTHYYTYNSSLVDNNIHDLFMDSDGDMLVICGKTLQIYNRSTGNFDNIAFPEGHVPVLSDIVQLPDGRIVVSNSKKGFWIVDKSARVARQYEAVEALIGKPETQIMMVDSRGRLWICTNHDGIFCYDPADDTALHLHVPDHISDVKGITGVAEMADGRIVILGMNAVYFFDESRHDMDLAFTFSSTSSIRRLYRSADDTLYVGSYGRGLYKLDLENKCLCSAADDVSQIYGLKGSGMFAFLEDADGSRWFAFNGRGLLQVSPHDRPFSYTPLIQEVAGKKSSLGCFCDIGDGKFLVGQLQNGLHLLDSSFNHVRTYLPGRSPLSVAKISDSKVWVGEYTRGAGILDLQTGHMEWVLRGKRVTDLTFDEEGNIYMSVFNGFLTSFTPDGKTERVLGDSPDGIRLQGRYLNCLFTDSNGLIWVGHHYGFDVYDPVADKVLKMPCDAVLRRSVVYDITESSDGMIWLGTSRGLFGYDPESQEWEHKNTDDGLLGDIVCSVQEAGDSTLWLGTYRGLIHYIRCKEKFSYYLKGNGLEEVSYARGVSSRMPDGRLCFGNDLGFTTFHPGMVTTDDFVKPVRKVSLVREGSAVDIDGKMTLTHEENAFRIRFSAMDFRNPENLSFEYRLSSSKNDSWRRTPVGYNEVDFNNLGYGDHTLSVRTIYNEESSEILETVITVRPPWYLSSLAKVIYVMLIVSMLVFAWSYYRHRKNAELSEEKIRFFIDVSHEIRSPLTLIKSPLESLLKESHDEKTMSALNSISRNTDRLMQLVDQILNIRRMEKGGLRMNFVRTDVRAELVDICSDFEYVSRKRNIAFVLDAKEAVEAWTDRPSLHKIIRNMVSNAFKYVSDGGKIEIILSRETDSRVKGPLRDAMKLVVRDNGEGIDENEIRHIFERFYQVRSSNSRKSLGYGIGLNLTSKLVQQHGGIITARNRADGSGAEFTIMIPLGKAHLPAEFVNERGDDVLPLEKERGQEMLVEDVPAARHSSRRRTTDRVVVVDDDEEIRNFLVSELGNIYHVSAYSDGQQALQAISENVPQLVISDVSMPVMDGFTLLHRLKNNTATSHVPVVMLTTRVEHDAHVAGFTQGADAYMDKPFDIEELIALCSSLIANRTRMKGKLTGMQEQEGVVKQVEMKGNDQQLMERVMKVVNERLCDSDFNVEALADEVGLSRVQLHRRIKDITGITVGEFIRNLRLKQAAELLAKGDVTVSQVTYALGMSNPTHFTAAFKRYFGVTPTEYMKKHSGATNS